MSELFLLLCNKECNTDYAAFKVIMEDKTSLDFKRVISTLEEIKNKNKIIIEIIEKFKELSNRDYKNRELAVAVLELQEVIKNEHLQLKGGY